MGSTFSNQGRAYFGSGDFKRAIEAYLAAYSLIADGEFLFEIGRAHEADGDKAQALSAFRRYREQSPGARHDGEAVARIASLESDIAKAAAPSDPRRTIVAPSAIPSWMWLGAGALLVGGGVTIDLFLESSQNRELDIVDFAPPTLYLIGPQKPANQTRVTMLPASDR